MLEKEVKRHLSCSQRNQMVGRESRLTAILSPAFHRTHQLAQSIWSEESSGNIFAPGECCVYLDHRWWSNTYWLYGYNLNIYHALCSLLFHSILAFYYWTIFKSITIQNNQFFQEKLYISHLFVTFNLSF